MKVVQDLLKKLPKSSHDHESVQKYKKELMTISLNQTKQSANGSVMSAIFYFQFQLECAGKTFNGKGGGFSSPGGGALFGDVYCENMPAFETLFRDTVSFQFNCTPVYTSLLFFNSSSQLLGHFQSGSVSTVLGVGGGSGSWE